MRFNTQTGAEGQSQSADNGQQENQPSREQQVAEQMKISLALAQAEASQRFVGLFNRR